MSKHKQPYFHFYPDDFLGGTLTMTMEERGAYITLLILQFHQGSFTETHVEHMLNISFSKTWPVIREKFKKEGNEYYNERLRSEIERRVKYSESRSKNRRRKDNLKGESKVTYVGTYEKHMKNICDHNNNSISNSNSSSTESTSTSKNISTSIRARKFLEDELDYVWGRGDQTAIKDILKKIKSVHKRKKLATDDESLIDSFRLFIKNVPDWVRKNKFSLSYLNKTFNEIYQHGKQQTGSDSDRAGIGASLREKATRITS